jgi:hypothetical protein
MIVSFIIGFCTSTIYLRWVLLNEYHKEIKPHDYAECAAGIVAFTLLTPFIIPMGIMFGIMWLFGRLLFLGVDKNRNIW